MPRETFSLLCDDIRLEQGNKVSLMGLYSKGLIVEQVPCTMARLCLYQQLEELSDGKNVLVQLKGPKLSVKAEIKIEKSVESLNLRVVFGPVHFEEEGDYRFETYIDNSDEPVAVKNFFVKLREDLNIT
jgi:hypothetical protein